MSSKGNMTLKFNQYWKPPKVPAFIYADVYSLIKRVDGCKFDIFDICNKSS